MLEVALGAAAAVPVVNTIPTAAIARVEVQPAPKRFMGRASL